MTSAFDINEVIRRLGLEPHPEGGHYRRTWAHPTEVDGRPLASSIIYLLTRGERSHWHRIDAVEQWHHYAGDPLQLCIADADQTSFTAHVLGGDVLRGQLPQHVVPEGRWQSALAMGDWSLVGCTVTPAFSFDGFELAPPGWSPEQ